MLTINNMITNQNPENNNVAQVVSELDSMANILNLETQKKVLVATGAISREAEFTQGNFSSLISKRIEKQIEVFERPTVCMFICPKLDVRDMQNPANLMPTKFSISSINGEQADIFVSRIPRISQLFENAYKNDFTLELVLIIGDSDFTPEIGYNWLAVQSALQNGATMGDFEDEIYASRINSYKNYLISLLNLNKIQNNIELFEAIGDEATSNKRVIRVLSLYETYKKGLVTVSDNYDFNMQSVSEEIELKYKFFQEQIDKYDPNFFKKITKEQVKEITLGKFRSYRDQGAFIQQMGGILIADELPPIVKAEMYGNELLMMWPWIRKEALERNPDYNAPKPPKIKLIEPAFEG